MKKKPCSIHGPGNLVWSVESTEDGQRCFLQQLACQRCGTKYTQTVYPDALSQFFSIPKRKK